LRVEVLMDTGGWIRSNHLICRLSRICRSTSGRTAVRHIVPQAGRPGTARRVMTWQLLMIGFPALLITTAVAVLLLAGILP
jgi:hypothetical protein